MRVLTKKHLPVRVYLSVAILTTLAIFYMGWTTHRIMSSINQLPETTASPMKNRIDGVAIVSYYVHDPDNMHYLECVCKLGRALRTLEDTDRVLMLLSNTISREARVCGWKPEIVQPIPGPSGAKENRYLKAHMYSKLHIWNMTQYHAVFFLDLDTLPIRPFAAGIFGKELASTRYIAMGWNHPEQTMFNAGVILARPNSQLFKRLVSNIEKIPHDPSMAEQNYLNAFFPKTDIHPLPFMYNSMVSVKHERPLFWAASVPAILHYTCKPWNTFNCWKDGIEDLCWLWYKITT